MPADRKTLYIIDAHAQIFRAYYAIRGGMNSPVTGEPTNAVFGFAGMLLKLFRELKPHYVVMAADAPGKTFRDEIYPEYKATRDAPPADFRPQVDRIWQLTQLFGIPLISIPGAEADDVIATVIRRLLADTAAGEVDVRIVSKDKDLEQLLGDRVKLFDIHTDTLIDAASLASAKGITPAQVVDMLALMGDNVDNIRGVDGVGPKTAAQLIQQFGSIEGIYDNLDQIKGKRKERLAEAKDRMPLNRQLVRLKDDLDFPFTLEAASVQGIDGAGLQQLFEQLGFHRHRRDLDELLQRAGKAAAPAAEAPSSGDDDGFATSLFEGPAVIDAPAETVRLEGTTTAADFDYQAITTQAQLDDLAAALAAQKLIAVDTETIGLGEHAALCGLCFAWKPGHGVYVPVCSPDPSQHLDEATVLDALRPVLENEAIGKCGHNLKYDLLVLRGAGVRMRGCVHDSMIAAFLLNRPSQGMDALALGELQHHNIVISSLIGAASSKAKQRTMDTVPLEVITPYAAEDADISLRLCQRFEPMLDENGMRHLATDIEMPLVEVLAEMQHVGIRLDPSVLEEQKRTLAAKIDELRDRIADLIGGNVNLDSPKQLGAALFDRLKFPVIKKTKSGASTDVEVMEKLAGRDDLPEGYAQVPSLILEYRQYSKLVGTYLGNLQESVNPRTGRIHARFHQTGAATGRLSSSDPNLQNIPIRTEIGRQIRKAFIADEGWHLISADYSQIELRVLAHLSEDPALLDAFHSDADIHRAVASQVFGVPLDQVTSAQRSQAKMINFGIIYGVTAFGLARRVEGLDKTAAGKLIADYRRRFAGIDRFLETCVHQAERHGYVTTITGRRRDISQITSRNPQTRALGERLAINTVVQGSAADLIKLAMVNLHRRIDREKLPMRLLLQIHDELVLEAPEAEADTQMAIAVEEMEKAMSMKVPLKVEAGHGSDWFSAK